MHGSTRRSWLALAAGLLLSLTVVGAALAAPTGTRTKVYADKNDCGGAVAPGDYKRAGSATFTRDGNSLSYAWSFRGALANTAYTAYLYKTDGGCSQIRSNGFVTDLRGIASGDVFGVDVTGYSTFFLYFEDNGTATSIFETGNVTP